MDYRNQQQATNPFGQQIFLPQYGGVPGVPIAAQFNSGGGQGGMLGMAAGLQAVAMNQNQQQAMLMAQQQQGGGGGGHQVNMSGVPPVPRLKVMCQHPGCGKEFAWQQDLSKHVRKYHSGEEPRFKCTHNGCGKRFYERKLLVAHERIHSDERPFHCTVPGCDKRFRARNALAYHLKALHNSGDSLKCTVEGCKFTTRKKEALAAHKLRHQQRDAERTWKAQAKGEVQAAVKSVKDDLKAKAAELAKAHKSLQQEQRAHAKVQKELTALKASHARLKRRVSTAVLEIDRLKPLKKLKGAGGGAGGANGDGTIAGGAGGRGGRGGKGAAGADGDEGGAGVPMYKAPEVALLDGPSGKLPMLAVGNSLQPMLPPPPGVRGGVVGSLSGIPVPPSHPSGGAGAGTEAGGGSGSGGDAASGAPAGHSEAAAAAAGGGGLQGSVAGQQQQQQVAPPPPQQHHAQSIVMNVNGAMRRLQPVCAQALPWSTSFIGCPGIRCSEGSDFTQLFREDGTRDAGNRRTTPMEVERPKDFQGFHARSASCPWSKSRIQQTLERASDPVALHALLNDIAPKKTLKVKRVDGQCEACYAAHVALAARLRAKLNPSTPKSRSRNSAAAAAAAAAAGGGTANIAGALPSGSVGDAPGGAADSSAPGAQDPAPA